MQRCITFRMALNNSENEEIIYKLYKSLLLYTVVNIAVTLVTNLKNINKVRVHS